MPRANRTNPPDTFTTGAAAPADGGVELEELPGALVLVVRVVAADEVGLVEAELVVAVVEFEADVVVAAVVEAVVALEAAEVAEVAAEVVAELVVGETVFVEEMLNCGV